ncbi:MAG: hypothetical protein KDI09_21645 [Halioglobus sp.]|nr:hypothetical protein [Halioglobus sp.]
MLLILGASGAWVIWRDCFRDEYLAQSIDSGNWGVLVTVLVMMALVGACLFGWSMLGDTARGNQAANTGNGLRIAFKSGRSRELGRL